MIASNMTGAAAGEIDPPDESSDNWCAAIDLPSHGAAVQVWACDKDTAISRRDEILYALNSRAKLLIAVKLLCELHDAIGLKKGTARKIADEAISEA